MIKYSLTTKADISRAAPKRGRFSDKYESGRAVVIGGSGSYYGAPSMALQSAYNTITALRIGVGYVRTYVPASVLGDVRKVSPNMIVNQCGRDEISFTEDLRRDIRKTDAVAIGMGIGTEKTVTGTVAQMIDYCASLNVKTVVDAGAIMGVTGAKKRSLHNVIITPHGGEFLKLTGVKVSETDVGKRITAAVAASRKLGVMILLKGNYTIITDGKKVKVNKTATPALATMGTGDVLTGMITGYAATGSALFDAAVAAAHLHSLIGDSLHRKQGNHIIATDIMENIPSAMKEFER